MRLIDFLKEKDLEKLQEFGFIFTDKKGRPHLRAFKEKKHATNTNA